MRLSGRNAVVTGGSRGIGAAVAEALVAEGAAVLIGARDGAAAEDRAAGLGEAARGARLDVTDPDSVRSFAEAAGGVDLLVNNAGTASAAPLAKIDAAEWKRLHDVNAFGTFLCTQAFAPGMKERGFGRVVNVASVAGLEGAPYIAAYTAAKHAVVGLTRALAAEFDGTGVAFAAVCPAYVDTDLTRETVARIRERTGRSEEEARAFLAETSGGRILEPAEVAAAVVELCVSGENGAIRRLPAEESA